MAFISLTYINAPGKLNALVSLILLQVSSSTSKHSTNTFIMNEYVKKSLFMVIQVLEMHHHVLKKHIR